MSTRPRLLLGCCLTMVILACQDAGPARDDRDSTRTEPLLPVLLVGFDGATWDVLQGALDRGDMPRLARLIEDGTRARLETLRPTLTPVIWTTIATGKEPGKHGIEGLVVRDRFTGKRRPISSLQVRCRRIWEILQDRGIETCVVRWPVTWPAQRGPGRLISDRAHQTSRTHRTSHPRLDHLVDECRPDVTLQDLVPLTGVDRERYETMEDRWRWKLLVQMEEYALDLHYAAVAHRLLEERQSPFTAVYFHSLDSVGHQFFRFGHPDVTPKPGDPDLAGIIPAWCRLYDDLLAGLLERVRPDTRVILCSDHGMQLAREPQDHLIRAFGDPSLASLDRIVVPPAPPFDTPPFSFTAFRSIPSGQHVHAPAGIFAARGPGLADSELRDPVHVSQITPLVLSLCGLPSARDMDGKRPDELLQPRPGEDRARTEIESYERPEQATALQEASTDRYTSEDDQILERLAALGYL